MAKWTKSTLLDRLGDELVEQGYVEDKDDMYVDTKLDERLTAASVADLLEDLKAAVVRESMVRRQR